VKLIVGLGNPGKIYVNSRHNIGFSVVEALAKVYKISLKKETNTFSLSGKGRIEGQNVILSEPLTFMNLSGLAVSALLKKHKIALDNLLVVCDDLDLAFGRLKIKASGSSGGHRGLNSIMDALSSQNFCRLRIGIGRPHINTYPAEYVLSPFTREEKELAKEIIKRASHCCRVWVKKGITECMNIFNRSAKIK
jgi:PTH1 family peptidyl-tRNA hydrolase